MKLEDQKFINQIDWVLARPDMSPWLKNALEAARGCDPVAILNDLEILNHVLRGLSRDRIQSAFRRSSRKMH